MERLPGDSQVAGDDGLGDPRTDAGFRVTDLFDSESGLLRILEGYARRAGCLRQ